MGRWSGHIDRVRYQLPLSMAEAKEINGIGVDSRGARSFWTRRGGLAACFPPGKYRRVARARSAEPIEGEGADHSRAFGPALLYQQRVMLDHPA